jgi:chemotaxis signal transduction protein
MSSEARTPAVASAPAKNVEPLLAFADALLAAEHGERNQRAEEIQQYVTFFLRDDEIGIPIMQCREIVRVSTITRFPEAPAHVRGVVNLRGRIIPAVDTRKCLGYDVALPTMRCRLIVVEVAGRFFALLVDRVARILKLAISEIELHGTDTKSSSTIGLVRDGDVTIRLIDVERMLRAAPAADASLPKE